MSNNVWYATTEEHALLAEVIKVAHEKRTKDGKPDGIGRTALQKIVYFLKVLDVPMRYRFEIYTYGPFCANILSDTEWLEADEVVNDLATDKKSSSFSPGINLNDLLERHKDFLDRHRKTIDGVARGLASSSPSSLELISTTDYASRWLRTELGKSPSEQEVIERVGELKKDKFSLSERKRAYQWLCKVGLAV